MQLAFKSTLLSKQKIADETFKLDFSVPQNFSFIPGQYIWVLAKGERRAFSISSPPDQKNSLSIIFRTSQSVFKQTLINAPVGAVFSLIGPFGSLGLPENPQQTIIFIAGGVGIAPFLSILRYLKTARDKRKIVLFYANSGPGKAAYLNELKKLKKFLPGFNLYTIFGKLNINYIKEKSKALIKPHWYVLGPSAMVEKIGSELLKTEPVSQISFEEFYPVEFYQSITQTGPEAAGIFKLAVENSFNHIIITDSNGKIQYANKASQLITGFSIKEILGQTPRLWGGLMDRNFYKNLWQTIKVNRKPFHGEIKNRQKTGQEYTAIVTVSPIIDKQNILRGFIGTEEDISKLKEAEANLKEKTKELKKEKNVLEAIKAKDETILNHLPIGVIMINAKNGRILEINPKGTEILGQSIVSQPAKKTFSATYHVLTEEGKPYPEDDMPINIALREKKDISKDDIVVEKPDGKKINIRTVGIPVKSGGELIYALGLFEDITQHKKVDQGKNEFISLASHQLRTPASTIKWYTESLLSGDLGKIEPKQKEYIEEIYEASKRMDELISTLLNVSRIELGIFSIKPKKINLEKIARNILNDLKLKINEKKITVKENFPAVSQMKADPDLVRIIFQNLLTNSVNYSRNLGRISLKIEKKTKDFLISVEDEGIGIPKNQGEKIFTKLFRADNAREFKSDGTGLGLYIVKSIVDHVGGKIWFESKKKGTIFYVKLPSAGMKKKEGIKSLI